MCATCEASIHVGEHTRTSQGEGVSVLTQARRSLLIIDYCRTTVRDDVWHCLICLCGTSEQEGGVKKKKKKKSGHVFSCFFFFSLFHVTATLICSISFLFWQLVEVLVTLNEPHVSKITLHYQTWIRLVIMFFFPTVYIKIKNKSNKIINKINFTCRTRKEQKALI